MQENRALSLSAKASDLLSSLGRLEAKHQIKPWSSTSRVRCHVLTWESWEIQKMRGTQLQNTHAQYHNIEQAARRPDLKKIELSSKEQKTIPENLPLPTDIYKLKYQQYETEMKEGYKQYSQRAAKKKINNLFHDLPGKIAEKKDLQPEKQRVDEFTILDEKALLQQGYTNNPYTMQHSIRKFDVEEVAAERKKQAVVEQVMLDQLCRAVISDPEQNGNSDIYKMDPVLPGLSTAPLRFRKRTLHETKIKTRSALTENMLSNKLRFDGRLLLRNGRDACRELIGFYFTCDKSLTIYEYRKFGKNRTNALPFILKGIYMHQRGQRKGKPYTLNDFFVGADLTFLSLQHPGLPESVKQKPLFTIRVTNIDEMAKTFLKTYNVENEENPLKEEDDRKKTLRNVQGNATEEEIKSSFLETLEDACSNPNEVSFGEFEDYYEGLSIGILDDEDFINILRNPWGI
ncbi:Calcyphosin-2, partial [Ophiophagus hannah]